MQQQKQKAMLSSTVGKLWTLSHNIMVYYTLKSFVADDSCRSRSCSSSHPTAALKGQKGLSHSIQVALSTAYHPCDLALWWLHHADCVAYGGLTPLDSNLMGRTSYLTDHSACDFAYDSGCVFSLCPVTQHCVRQTLSPTNWTWKWPSKLETIVQPAS